MKHVVITRTKDDGIQSTGSLFAGLFQCFTLELPWKLNQSNISCIPTGTYIAKWTRSNRLSTLKGVDVFTYEILGVSNRAGIRIHSASFYHDLLGCVSLGSAYIDLDGDGELDLINSRRTIQAFNDLCNKEDLEIIIQNQ